jgi:hypothetical protein
MAYHRFHESEKQYTYLYRSNGTMDKNETEFHSAWSCAALTDPEAAFCRSMVGDYICLYCGAISSSNCDEETRSGHLTYNHNFRECNLGTTFFRVDHFRQHLEQSHAASTDQWRNDVLEEACMKDEPLPETLVIIPPQPELADYAGPLVERPELPGVVFEGPADSTGPVVTMPSPQVPDSPVDSPLGQSQHESSQANHYSLSPELTLPQYSPAPIEQIDLENSSTDLAQPQPSWTSPPEVAQSQTVHECQICHRNFARRTILRNHQRTHTGEKPFPCGIQGCGQSFAQQSDKTRHEQAQHNEKVFRCGSSLGGSSLWGCGKTFRRKDGLLEHHRKTAKGRKCLEERDKIDDPEMVGVDSYRVTE